MRQILLVGPVAEPADEQIEEAIAVEITPGGPMAQDAGKRLEQPGGAGDVLEANRLRGGRRTWQREKQQTADCSRRHDAFLLPCQHRDGGRRRERWSRPL